MLQNDASSIQTHAKREPISEPWAVFFVSFRVWVRLLPPSWHPRWPRSTKACQNHQKTHLEHAKLVKKRTLQDHVSGGPEPDNSCLLFFFFWLPWLTNPNQNTEQSARSATHVQKRGRHLLPLTPWPDPRKHGAAVNRRRRCQYIYIYIYIYIHALICVRGYVYISAGPCLSGAYGCGDGE